MEKYFQLKSALAANDPDQDGKLQVEQMGSFLQAAWNFNPGEWGVKYWHAINAYNSSYGGITADDFLDCWMHFDMVALTRVRPPGHPKAFNYANAQPV